MRERLKNLFTARTVVYIVCGVVMVAAYTFLQNLTAIRSFLAAAGRLLSPFAAGVLLAYLLNLILRPAEEGFLSGIKRAKLRRAAGIVLVLAAFFGLLAALIYAIIPQLILSISQMLFNLQRYFDGTESLLSDAAEWLRIDSGLLEQFFGGWEEFVALTGDLTRQLVSAILDFSIQLGYGIFNGLVSLFVAVYILADKERLVQNAKRILFALLSAKRYGRATGMARRGLSIFRRYLTRTFIDSVLVGALCYAGMTVMGIPYALLVSVTVGLTNVVPTFGPFLGGIPGALLILLFDPIQALLFSAMFIAIEIFDSHIIVPKLLHGLSGGLSGFWALAAIWVSGNLFGLAGLILGLPVFATLYCLCRDYIVARLKKKGFDKNGLPVSSGADPAEQKP